MSPYCLANPSFYHLDNGKETRNGLEKGTELAMKIMKLRKDIPVIMRSGYSEIIDEERAKAIGIREYLMKPILPNNLASTVRRVLG